MSSVFPITDDPRYRRYTASAGQRVFSIPFPFLQDEDVAICLQTAPTEYSIFDPSAYVLSGANDPVGGSVTLNTGRAAGDIILVIGVAILDRMSSIVRDGRFSSGLIDSELDRIRIIEQEFRRDNERSVKVDYGKTGLILDPDLEDGDTLMKQGNRLSKGANLPEVAAGLIAQATAQANRSKTEADRSKAEADRSQSASAASALSASSSATSATFSQSSADRAELAAGASGNVSFFDTYAAASAALPGLPEGRIVEVIVDETRNNDRTRYRVVGGALVYKITIGGIPEKAPYVLKSAATFDVLSYVRNVDKASAEAIQAFNVAGQDGDKVLAAVRAAGDEMMTYVRSQLSACAILQMPVGLVGLKDELFSDAFQENWWTQNGLGKGKHIYVKGAASDVSRIEVRSDYVSSVRNLANGNQRSYGPWAGGPSPSILIPSIADRRTTAPAALSLQGLRLFGTRTIGRDPIPWFTHNELDARHDDLHFQWFSNHGQVINGSYNSKHVAEDFETCGLQPIEGGSIMGYTPGFPPRYAFFDVAALGSTVTVTARARSTSSDGYTAGDAIPYFKNDHVGKEFFIAGAAQWSSFNRTTRLTIASVGGDGKTAAMTLPSGVTGRTATGLPGSFGPVKAATTAASDVVVLSDAVLFGRGSDDMVGHLVAIPKAGSTERPDYDTLSTRVLEVSNGNNTDGFKQLRLAHPARLSATDLFMTGIGHNLLYDETLLQVSAGTGLYVNDTDFLMCRWEYSHSTEQAGAPQFAIQGQTGAVNYTSCKVHGCNPAVANFASEGQIIFDNIAKTSFVGVTFTHLAMRADGHVRMMGRVMREVNFTDVELGTWTQPGDVPMFFFDPSADAVARDWSVALIGPPRVFDTNFPFGTQKMFAGRGMNEVEVSRRVRSRGQAELVELSSLDDMNNIRFNGDFYIGASVPANAPPFGNYCTCRSRFNRDGTRGTQEAIDVDSKAQYFRAYNTSASGWSTWVELGVAGVATTPELNSPTSSLNTMNKRNGRMIRSTTDGYLYVAVGGAANSEWWGYERRNIISPA
ncbi:pyocin knob domain-containing protein [Agrobacterium tumefaciens]|uniref:pyocin knob domain-containing protein n=1 Tax=Agrobacterium tumefaciens TaxID=358 RepID=UPI003BA0A793